MVDGSQKPVLVGAETHHAQAQQRRDRQVERRPRIGRQQFGRPPLGIGLGAQVDERKLDLARWMSYRHGPVIADLESGPQDLMTPHDLLEAAAQRGHVEGPLESGIRRRR